MMHKSRAVYIDVGCNHKLAELRQKSRAVGCLDFSQSWNHHVRADIPRTEKDFAQRLNATQATHLWFQQKLAASVRDMQAKRKRAVTVQRVEACREAS